MNLKEIQLVGVLYELYGMVKNNTYICSDVEILDLMREAIIKELKARNAYRGQGNTTIDFSTIKLGEE